MTKLRRRGSLSSLASGASFAFRRRSNSVVSSTPPGEVSIMTPVAATPLPSGKAATPPVSYPMAKRYGFKRHGDTPSSNRPGTMYDSSRPGSVFSLSSTPLTDAPRRLSSAQSARLSIAGDRQSNMGFPLMRPPPLGPAGHRASVISSDGGRSSRLDTSDSPQYGRSPRQLVTPPPRVEPMFDRPCPFTPGRAPVLRVYVPLSDKVRRWPSAEGAHATITELDKCGARRRMRLGDLVVSALILK